MIVTCFNPPDWKEKSNAWSWNSYDTNQLDFLKLSTVLQIISSNQGSINQIGISSDYQQSNKIDSTVSNQKNPKLQLKTESIYSIFSGCPMCLNQFQDELLNMTLTAKRPEENKTEMNHTDLSSWEL